MLAASTLYVTYAQLQANATQEVSILSSVIANNVAPSIAFDDHEITEEALGALAAHPSILLAGAYNASNIVGTYRREGVQESPPETPPPPGHYFQDERIIVIEPIVFHGQTIGSSYTEFDSAAIRERTRDSLYILAGLVAASMAVGFLVSWIAAATLAGRG